MRNTARFRRDAAALGLVLAAALMIVSVSLAPEWGDSAEERLRLLHDGGTPALISALAFTLAQLPLIAGVLGIGHLLRERSPRLANIGTTVALLGCFGHAVVGGIQLAIMAMADDTANRAVYTELLPSLEAGPIIPFLLMGLAGTVLGLLMLSIGLFRARVAPRWVGPVLWAFLVVEFVGTNISEWASYLAGLLYVGALGAVALTIWQSRVESWAAPAPAPTEEARLVA